MNRNEYEFRCELDRDVGASGCSVVQATWLDAGFFLKPPPQRGMAPLFSTLLSSINCSLLTLFTLILAYAVSGLGKLIVAQHFSHLGELNCPPVPSYFWGHLQLLHDAENTNLYMKWMEQLGTVFTYRGFIGVCVLLNISEMLNDSVSPPQGRRLVTMDIRAITHILSLPHQYPKPSFVRDTLASMAGEQGLLVVEGEQIRMNTFLSTNRLIESQHTQGEVHKRQVRFVTISGVHLLRTRVTKSVKFL